MLLISLISFLQCVMSYDFKSSPQKTASNAKLVYYGGPVISNVQVYIVWWGGVSNVRYSSNLPQFYSGVTNSSWFNVLNQYSNIGYGSYAGAFNDVFAPTGALTDAQVQSRIVTLVSNGTLPSGPNYYYAVHFAPGISIDQSCVTFCAYHGTISYNGNFLYYGVLPDLGTGGCVNGCGSNPNPFNNLCSVASHELAEAVTDAGVGLATTYSYPIAWYDSSNGEIGDICNAQQGQTLGGNGITFTIQKIFSNRDKSCVVSISTTTTKTTTTTTKTSTKTTTTTVKTSTKTTTKTATTTAHVSGTGH